MRAYSTNFRKKIVDTYHSEPLSQRQLANRFNVAKSFIQKLLKQYRETGDIQPKPHAGGGELKLTPEDRVILVRGLLHELAKAIEDAFNQVTKKDLRSWFAHGCYCTSDA